MRRLMDWTGRVFVALGAALLLFAGYQLWGTNWVQAADQRELKAEFEQALGQVVAQAPGELARAAPATNSERPPVEDLVAPPAYEMGEATGVITIPAIGVDQAMVEGAGRDELKKGPGHYPHSPLPGFAGNASVAGHRTTYGAPFNRLDELVPGDEIVVTTTYGEFTYVVTGHQIVDPGDVSVVDRTDDNRLTLTTCHPKYSARERLIVSASLVGDPVDAPPPTPAEAAPAELATEDLSGEGETARAPVANLDGDSESGVEAVGWGLVAWSLLLAAVGAGWWWMFRGRRHWTTWVGGAIPFLLVLFVFFGEVEQVLPANY